ncbi:MAG TPA: hypothetical protein VKD28_04180 [Gemmatimonadales bacterium]|nr:hypothetical protein [Gemmatimonadales bacterium]
MAPLLRRLAAATAAALGLAACDGHLPPEPEITTNSTTTPAPSLTASLSGSEATDTPSDLATLMDNMNVVLGTEGADYRVAMAEYVTDGSDGVPGDTVLAKNVGNKMLSADFVPGDPRRAEWSGAAAGFDNITFAIDGTGDAVPPRGGLTAAQTDAAIVSAMTTWDQETCSDLALTRNASGTTDIGFVAALNGLGGSFAIVADVQHAGWRDINFAGGILGVTFTFVFVTDDGAPTDINADGRADAAFRETYYDPSFIWRTDGGNVDVQTVALHESGHGLSQAHFGTVVLRSDNTLRISPRAVMNAVYAGPLRELTGTDDGGHCANWANWPVN